MGKINLYGISGHSYVVMDIIRANGLQIGVLYDDNPQIHKIPYKIIQPTQNLDKEPLIISIGSNQIRKALANKYNVKYATLIHPSAIVSPNSKIGEGTVIMQSAIIQAFAKIGKHCIINTGSSVDHECIIDDFVHISPHATLCGNVHVGESTWIGAGAIVIQGVKIGKNCIIGAGSVVLKDIPDNTTAFGNPAKIKKFYV